MSRLALLRLALAQHAQPEGDWLLSRAERWWMTGKTVLSLLILPRTKGSQDYRIGEVVVAIYDYHEWQSYEWGLMSGWNELTVRRHGFGWALRSDGAP